MQYARSVCGGILLAFCLGWWTPIVEAQESKKWIDVPNEEIPLYQMVFAFFIHADLLSQDPDPRFYNVMLRDLGIQPDSPEANIFKDSVLAASQFLHTPPTDSSHRDEKAAIASHFRTLKTQIDGFSQVLAEMLVALEALGYPQSQFMNYLENKVRPSISAKHNGLPHDLEAIRLKKSFDAQLQRKIQESRRDLEDH